ncbi:SMI1/KNR4 family protein [Streptomyces sp. Ru71]|uniref:SMI1/KNR4 family protein n=1 Tax=Streptomyces sp. Ru71 TaxID=2080746 RepID=UPI0021562CDC|nr:SMI1/KNR4 family protein [Streptomyces sp. Ru71]
MILGPGDFATVDPGCPPSPVPVDWGVVEAWLGVRLPREYKALAERYGSVEFGEFLTIPAPCVQDGVFDYGDWLGRTHREARIAAQAVADGERPLVHPAPGGLLAWGVSHGDDILFWDTSVSDDPDAWTVVVHHCGAVPGSGLRPWHAYDLTMTGYLRHTVRDGWETPDPPGPLMGPLPGTLARPEDLTSARPWPPPTPVPPRLSGAERRLALETGTGLDALRLLCPPPPRPYLGDGTWEGLFTELGTRLPGEYVRVMEVYGAGIWSDWLRFHTPLRTGEPRFATHVHETLDAYRSLKKHHPEYHPLTCWPEPGGFLPFANSIDGDYLGWLTEGADPDAWPLVFWPRHADQEPPLEGGLVDTLLAWLRGRLVTPGLCVLIEDEYDDPLDSAEFESWDDRAHW